MGRAYRRKTGCRHGRPSMNSKPGTYALVLRAGESRSVKIGRRGPLDLRPGYYIYVGSAFGPGGVSARVLRHCRAIKSKHWHIDYLREVTSLVSVWYSHASVRLEHRWAGALANWRAAEPVKGFGCSDCRCESHLFFTEKEPALAQFSRAVRARVKSWSRKPPAVLATPLKTCLKQRRTNGRSSFRQRPGVSFTSLLVSDGTQK